MLEQITEIKKNIFLSSKEMIVKFRMWLLLSPAFIQITLFFIFPILFFFAISFYHTAELTRYVPGFTFQNYINFFRDAFYLNTFLFTFKLTIVVTVVTLVVAYPVAYLIAKSKPISKTVYLVIIVIIMWTQYIIKIYGLVILLASGGLINTAFLNFGIIDEPIKMLYTFFSVAMGLIQVSFPYMVLSLLGVLENIDSSLKDAARNLGAGRIKTFLTVTLPLSVPGIAAGCIFASLWTLGSYATPALLGSEAETTVAMRVEHLILNTFDWPYGSVLAFNMLFSIIAIYLFLNSFMKEKRRQ